MAALSQRGLGAALQALTVALLIGGLPGATAASPDLSQVLAPLKEQLPTVFPVRFTRALEVGLLPEVTMLAQAQKRVYPPATELAWVTAMGLLPPEFPLNRVTQQLSQTNAIYEAPTLMLRQDVPATRSAQLDLVEALAEAAMDPVLDLPTFLYAPTLDQRLARRSIVEGAALLASSGWRRQQGWDTVPDNSRRLRPMLAEVPPYLALRVALPALTGRRILTDLPAALTRFHDQPPASTEQLLHPEKATDPPVLLNFSSSVPFSAPETLGAMLCPALLLPANQPLPEVALGDTELKTPCDGWGGDTVLQKDGHVLWIAAWDSPAQHDTFVAAFRRVHPDTPMVTRGKRVALISFGLSAEDWATVQKGTLTATQAGAVWAP